MRRKSFSQCKKIKNCGQFDQAFQKTLPERLPILDAVVANEVSSILRQVDAFHIAMYY